MAWWPQGGLQHSPSSSRTPRGRSCERAPRTLSEFHMPDSVSVRKYVWPLRRHLELLNRQDALESNRRSSDSQVASGGLRCTLAVNSWQAAVPPRNRAKCACQGELPTPAISTSCVALGRTARTRFGTSTSNGPRR
jgi:hypothetical protein